MAGLKQDMKNSFSKSALSVSEETVTWPLDREHGRWVRDLTDFIMDQKLLRITSTFGKSNKEVFLGITDVGYNFVSQGFEFTEPVLGVAFLIAPVKQFTLRNVLVNFPINPGGA